MTSLSKAASGLVFNVVVNTGAASILSDQLKEDNPNYVGAVVAIDTVFRIGIVHALSAMKLPPEKAGTLGCLIFPCLTLLTQPLSDITARRVFKIKNIREGVPKESQWLHMMAYIFFGWKVNMMAKTVFHLCITPFSKKEI